MKNKLKALSDLIAGVIAGAPAALVARMDAAYDTMFLARELTQIESEQYRVQYPDIEFRQHIPIKNSGLNPGAKFFVYRVWDYMGMAKWISSYADDLPNVAIRSKEVASTAQAFGNSYQFSAEELMQASMAGLPLEREEANAAFEFMERFMDQVAWLGDAAVGMLGFLKHPNVGVTTPAADGTGSATTFASKTPAQILRDLYAVSLAMQTRSKKLFTADTLLLPPSLYGFIATKPVSDLQPLTTVLDVFKATDPYVKNVMAGPAYMETADAAGTGPRAVFYKKDPRAMSVYIPLEPRAIPPQERNLAVIVNIWGKLGGFILRQPLAMQYVDGW